MRPGPPFSDQETEQITEFFEDTLLPFKFNDNVMNNIQRLYHAIRDIMQEKNIAELKEKILSGQISEYSIEEHEKARSLFN